MSDIVVTNGRTLSGDQVDIKISDGYIDCVEPAGELVGTEHTQYDADGGLITPTFSEPHVHLDIGLTAGEPQWNQSGTLTEGISLWNEYKQDLSAKDVRERAEQTIKWLAANGVTRVRTHVDTTEETLTGVRELLKLKEEYSSLIDLEVVAFPQAGLLSDPQHEDLLLEAMELGADLVGGIPHFELTYQDGVKSIEVAMDLAETHDCGVDMHIDEVDDAGSRFTEVLASESLKRDIGDRVTASHTTALHSYPNDYANKVIGMIADSGMSVITNPLDNSVLQGRYDEYPRRRGHTRIDELHEANVTVGIGHDSIMDPVYHYGTGDPLDAAYVLIHYAHMNGYTDVETLWEMLTHANASILGVEEYGLEPGTEGSLLVFDAETPFDVLRTRAARTVVINSGRVVARTDPARTRVTGSGDDELVTFTPE